MELESFDLKVSDLPREVEIRVPDGANDETVRQMIDDLKSEVMYNSRYNEETQNRELKIEIVGRTGQLVKLRIS